MVDYEIFTDYNGRAIRLTNERWMHIIEHPEMVDQRERLVQTLSDPEIVVATISDPTVHVYHRFFRTTPVTSKYMMVMVKIRSDDAFIVTAFYTSRQKKGTIIWQP